MFDDAVGESLDQYLNGNHHDATALIARKQPEHVVMPTLPAAVEAQAEGHEEASPWLDAYVRFSRLWSPRAYDDFHESVGLWLLSTVAARRVMLNLGKPRYTNLYIALAARTSIYAKSTTAELAQSVLDAAGLGFLLAPDDATPQAFVRGLNYALPADWDRLDEAKRQQILRKLAFAAQQGWYFDEFGQKVSSMMREGGHMADFRGLLRKFDDTPSLYEYVTIGRGRDIVQRPYLALLANLTPADLKPYAKRGAALWNDGFWARFAFLTPPSGHERKRGRFPRESRTVPPELYEPLQQWHRRLGVPTVEIDERTVDGGKSTHYELVPTAPPTHHCTLGKGVYDAFYTYNDALSDIIDNSAITDLDGNYTRLAEKALRVAMLLGSIENNNVIEMRHWARAQHIAETWRRNLHHLYQQVSEEQNTNPAVGIEQKVMDKIAERGPMTKREIYQYVADLDSRTATDLLKRMVEMGMLGHRQEGRTERYYLVSEDA